MIITRKERLPGGGDIWGVPGWLFQGRGVGQDLEAGVLRWTLHLCRPITPLGQHFEIWNVRWGRWRRYSTECWKAAAMHV